jgi:phage terminase large subunit
MGAGKSRIGCEKILDLALRYPGAQFAIVRKTAASLTATTERTFWRDVMPGRMGYVVARNKSDRWVEVAKGRNDPSRIWFMGLDADAETGVASKVGSFDGAAIFADEAVELTEADWIMLLGRLRDPRMPWHQLMAATNPSFPTHWLKQRFTPPVPGEREYFHATAQDNRFLPADFQRSIAALPDNVFGQRLGQGLWVMAEGAIYQFPPEQVQTPDPATKWKEIVAGIDWGYVHAFACEIVGMSGSGRLSVLGEVYRTGTLVEDIIPVLLRLQERLGISAFYADPSEPEYIATCQRAGLAMVPAINDVSPGINVVATAMKGGMTIDPACTGLLNELPAYRWAPDGKSGGLKDQPLKENDDACDALRYAVMGITRGGVLLHV